MSKTSQRIVSAYSRGQKDAEAGNVRVKFPKVTSESKAYSLGYNNPEVPYKLSHLINTDALDAAMEYYEATGG